VLFLAGVRTIIGSLWDVETGCAETFFTAFYTSLATRKDKLAAFSEAQRLTRKRHPQYRDWGAFYFSGDWL
jgi:CHAT domain-containing protein